MDNLYEIIYTNKETKITKEVIAKFTADVPRSIDVSWSQVHSIKPIKMGVNNER